MREPGSPGWLSDCVSKDPAVCEILIVQLDFAEVARGLRNRFTQAVLPIDASILEIEGAELIDVLDNDQVQSVIAALGAGICLDNDESYFSLEKLRYDKVIVVTDGTDEGRHIREQLTSFMHIFNRPLVAAGHFFTVAADDSEEIDTEEFDACVMEPETRQLVPVPARPESD